MLKEIHSELPKYETQKKKEKKKSVTDFSVLIDFEQEPKKYTKTCYQKIMKRKEYLAVM
jgi:hypothetical protein